MTLSISRNKSDNTFSYEVNNGRDLIEAGNGYPSQREAEIAARVCYHELHRLGFVWPHPFAQNDYMSLEDVLAELG